MKKTSRFLSFLCPFLFSILLLGAMMVFPRFVGEEAETVPFEISPAATDLRPESEIYLIPQFTVPSVYNPEDMMWITCDEPLDESASIPFLAMSYRPAGRILTDAALAAKLVEIVNELPYTDGGIPLIRQETVAYYAIRFGLQEPIVTVYANGYVSFSDWNKALPLKNTECYDMLAEVYEQAASHFSWMPLWVEDNAGGVFADGRLYLIGDKQYVIPLPLQRLTELWQNPDGPPVVTAEDVLKLTDLLTKMPKENTTIHFDAFGAHGEGNFAADRVVHTAAVCYHWLCRLTAGAGLYGITEDENNRPVIAVPQETDFWYFPQLPDGVDGGELLLRYYKGEQGAFLAVPCFHFVKGEILYYSGLADGTPILIVTH